MFKTIKVVFEKFKKWRLVKYEVKHHNKAFSHAKINL